MTMSSRAVHQAAAENESETSSCISAYYISFL